MASSGWRCTWATYHAELSEASRRRQELEALLHRALQEERLEVYFQPQIDLKTSNVIAREALMRWQLQDGTFIPPGEFIPVAESTGLIKPLGEYLMRVIARHAREAHEAGDTSSRFAINVSFAQFIDPEFVNKLIDALDKEKVSRNRFEIELTETVLASDVSRSETIVRELDEAGFSIAIDDFGSGYSSLSYLKNFPFDRLKIDKSFIFGLPADQNSAVIVRASIGLGHELGLKVLAEGVETAEQRDLLVELGCDEAQGYYFGKPAPFDVNAISPR